MYLIDAYGLDTYFRRKNFKGSYKTINEKKVVDFNVNDFIELYGDSHIVSILDIDKGNFIDVSFKELLYLVGKREIFGMELIEEFLRFELEPNSILRKWVSYGRFEIFIDDKYVYMLLNDMLRVGRINHRVFNSPFILVTNLDCYVYVPNKNMTSIMQDFKDIEVKVTKKDIESGKIGLKYELLK